MACDLSAGRALPCKDVVGGITAVYFVNFDTLGTITVSSTTDEVTDVALSPSVYKYDFKR